LCLFLIKGSFLFLKKKMFKLCVPYTNKKKNVDWSKKDFFFYKVPFIRNGLFFFFLRTEPHTEFDLNFPIIIGFSHKLQQVLHSANSKSFQHNQIMEKVYFGQRWVLVLKTFWSYSKEVQLSITAKNNCCHIKVTKTR